MLYRKMLVEPAKTGKSKCKKCGKTIQQGTLRVHVKDPTKFLAALRRYGGGGEGAYRGYVQTGSQVISIEKYFVHLHCYKAVRNHPYSREYFDLKKVNAAHHKAAFNSWLEGKGGKAKEGGDDKDDEDKGDKKGGKSKKTTTKTAKASRTKKISKKGSKA